MFDDFDSMEAISPLVPESDHKLLTHIRRMTERQQRKKTANAAEAATTHESAKPSSKKVA